MARLVDFIFRRKAYIILAVVFGIMLLFFLRTVPGRNKQENDVLKGSENKQIDLSWISYPSKKKVVPVRVGGEEIDKVKSRKQDILYENIPFNKGNVAMRTLKDSEEDSTPSLNWPSPAEQPSVIKDNPAEEDRFDPLSKAAGEDEDPENKKLDIDTPSPININKPPSPAPSPAPSPVNKPPSPASAVSAHQTSSFDKLYVHSSMPLGPALKIEHTERQKAVVEAFKHAWKGYKSYAWGYDELRPLSKSGTSHLFGLGMTIIDSLDVIWLMGLQEEFDEARNWVSSAMNIGNNFHIVSLFETNIRVLGGLLSTYHLSQDELFLQKAVELGNHLLPAFNTNNGVPCSRVDLKHGLPPDFKSSQTNAAEAGTLQLEFRELSQASGDPVYKEKADKNVDALIAGSGGGLVTQTIQGGRFVGGTYTVGGAVDSYYEYMLKEWLQSGKTEDKILKYHKRTVEEIAQKLVGYSYPSKMAFLGTRRGNRASLIGLMDHLSCFYPGLLALGIYHGLYPEQQALAANLTHTCYNMYKVTTTGLAADSIGFNTDPNRSKDTITKFGGAARSVQRPETVEALFYLYRLTKDPKYREWGWEIFQAFERSTKISSGGYAELRDANRGTFDDKMESFFLSETLKYLFLLFGDDDSVLSLDEWVFNTEAHPLRVWRSQITNSTT